MITRDPYRIFFPLGILFGVVGVAIWPAYSFHLTATYSGRAHALVQTFGFLYAFVAGFLLTAVPRFTGTPPPSMPAQYALALTLLVSVVSSELRAFEIGTTAFLVAHMMLLALVVGRFVRRRQNPPPPFALIGLALAAGLAGAIIESAVAWELVSSSLDLLGKRLLTEGMVMLLVLGIGGFLGPRLLGYAPLPQHEKPIEGDPRLPAIAGAVLLAMLVADYGFGLAWTAWVRAVIVSGLIVSSLQLWHLPAVRTTLSWTIWIAHWVIAAGVWVVAAAPKYRADFLHLLFAGGFSLLILAIGMRVTLSHGGHDLSAERKSWPLRIALTLALIATLARIGAPFAPNTYFDHLMWAALLWIGGVLIWGANIIGNVRGSAKTV